VKQQIKPGTHLDADQISVFAEGAATTREREEVLAHLATCPECRDAVFLLQAQGEVSTVTAPAPELRTPRRWFMPLGLATAALAAGLTTLVLLRPHRPAPAQLHQDAVVNKPEPMVPPSAPGANQLTPFHAQSAKPAPRMPSPAAIPRPATGANPGQLKMDQKNTALAGASIAPPSTSPIVVAPPSVVRPPSPVASAKPLPPAKAPEAQANLPVTGRSIAKLEHPPSLRIEHDFGPDDGFSQLSGRVLDMSGALISGATVTLRNSAGATLQATTAGDGTFNIAGVTPGHYDLSVTSLGFETSRQSIDLKPRDLALLDSVLRVGASTETVSVQAEAPSLNTDSAEVSSVVSGLPSHLRSAATLTSGKRMLSLDSAGTLFLSRNRGKSWKKVKPAWAGKIVDISFANPAESEATVQVDKRKTLSGSTAEAATFQLTTNSGAHWISKDGIHWLTR
jgi:hypothetical protein